MTPAAGSGHATGPLPADLAGILPGILGPDGRFGHRQHVCLAFTAVHRYGAARAPEEMCRWLRHLAGHHGAPQKFHVTMTRAWTELVARHVAASPEVTDFDVFAAGHPALFDQRLLDRHYSPALLASATARAGWVPPDLSPLP